MGLHLEWRCVNRAAVLGFAGALAAAPTHAQDNILLVIADDIGVDRVAIYEQHPDPGNTPNIDRLAQEGLLFRNAWSNPWCSATRATILTGRYGFRTGIGLFILEDFDWPGLSANELAIPEVIAPLYPTAQLGKWHLSTAAQFPISPFRHGFLHFAGSQFNLPDYFDWEKTVDGLTHQETTYATTDTVDDAIQCVTSMPAPWFVWMAFNAPHGPIHRPPDRLHSFNLSGPPGDTPVVHVKAMIEAMDTEFGRLMDNIDLDDTTVIFVGDNGTYGGATDAPFDPEHAKGTVYEGGVRVPLIVAGSGVTAVARKCDALVNTTDLFDTIAELAGMPASAQDSISIVPYFTDPDLDSLREYAYAEAFFPHGPGPYEEYDRAIRNEHFKLIEHLDAPDELYNLRNDRFEQQNLLELPLTPYENAVFRELKARMRQLLESPEE